MTTYLINVTIHVLAALLWLGGLLFLAAAGAPVLRQVEPPELRARLFRRLGESFRRVSWASITVLLATGLLNLHFRGWLGPALSGDATLWSSPTGRSLALKLVCVAVMVLISAVHDFWIGPRSSSAKAGSAEALRLRAWAAWGGRINAIVGLILVWASVGLVRGG